MTYINYPNWTHTYPIYNNMVYTKPSKPNYGQHFVANSAGNNTCKIVFVLDKSSSMMTVRDSTISGYNEFLESQKIDSVSKGIKTFVSLYTFDGRSVSSVYKDKDILQTDKLNIETYNPNGYATNLLDAIGTVISDTNNDLSKYPQNLRSSVILVILTDGQENYSTVYDNYDIKTMVMKSTEANWGFMFLGANIDAFSVGSSFGFNNYNTIQLSGSQSSFRGGIEAASAMTTRMKYAYETNAYASTQSMYSDVGFTDVERDKASK